VPVIVNFVPETATSGLVTSAPIEAAGVAGAARGPGSEATPESVGMTSGVGVPEASAGRSKIVAPASDATVTAIFMWRFMAVSLFLRTRG
jgi:hypothetical protein